MKQVVPLLSSFVRQSLAGRIVFALVLGLLLAGMISEGAFLLLRNKSDRAPRTIELVIPAGTAERVAAGQAEPSIPQEMAFVVDDVLVVRNEDTTSHQLGPVWVPPGGSASLTMEQANDYSYACTFRPTRSLGLTVRSRATAVTRLQAVLMAGPPMAMLMVVYSLVLWPLPSFRHHRPAERLSR